MKLTNNPKPEFMKVTTDAPKVDDMSQFTTCLAALMEVIVGKKILHESLEIVNFYPIQAMQQIIPVSREISRRKRIPILVCNLTQPDGQVEGISVTHFGAIVSGSITRLFCVSYKNKFYDTKFGLHVICVSGCGAEIKTDSLYKELLAKRAPFHFMGEAIRLGHNEKLAKERFLLWKKELVAFFEEKNYGQALIIADKMLQYTKKYHLDDIERIDKCYKNLAICLKHVDNSRAAEESTQKPKEKSISSEEITWGSISKEKKYLLDKISAITVYRDSILANKEKKKSREQNPQARISGLRDNLFSSESSASRSSSASSSSSSSLSTSK